MYKILDWLIPSILTIILVVTFLLIPVFIYHAHKESLKEGFELKKADWACTAYKTNTPIMVQTGKVLLPLGGGAKCVQWTRLGQHNE